MSRRVNGVRQFVVCTLVLAAVLYGIACIHGCFPEVKRVLAAESYEAQQQKCVDTYALDADITRCRNRVKLAWITGPRDSGAEGGDR